MFSFGFFILRTILFASVHNLIQQQFLCFAIQLFGRTLQWRSSNLFFTRNMSSHKIDWILTTHCLLCLAFLYAHANSLTKDLNRDFIVVCVAFAYVAFRYLSCSLSSCFNVKWYYTVSIFVNIYSNLKSISNRSTPDINSYYVYCTALSFLYESLICYEPEDLDGVGSF